MSAINIQQIQIEKPKGFLNRLKWGINKFNAFLGIIAIPLVTYCVAIVAWEITNKATLMGFAFAVHGVNFTIGLWLDNLANSLMNITVEACLFGCVGLAELAKKREEEKEEKKYNRIAWGFALLSIVTVGFKVCNAPPSWEPFLSCVRISACIVYALKCHPKDENEHLEKTLQQKIEEKVNEISTHFTEQISRRMVRVNEELELSVKNISAQFLAELQADRTSEDEKNEVLSAAILAQVSELFENKIEILREAMTEELYQISEQKMMVNYQQIQADCNRLIEEKASAVKSSVESTIKRLNPPSTPAPSRTINSRPVRKEAEPVEGLSKKDFILMCLKENPNMKGVEIINKGKEKGLNIAPSTVSEARSGFITGVTEMDTDGKLEAVNVQQDKDNS